MKYYEVLPASERYHSQSPLTYCSTADFKPGQVLKVKVRNNVCLAVVLKTVSKPDFKTSPIESSVNKLVLSPDRMNLLLWTIEYYPSGVGIITKLFLPAYLERFKDDIEPSHKVKAGNIKPALNDAQKKAVQAFKTNKSLILNGVTGSGKTRIYLEIAKEIINSGKSILILTPEIALTAPLAEQFKKIFKEAVEVNHSNLTPKQKLGLYQRLFFAENPKILIGPRSSLFLTLNNVGAIVIDEFHESAYKQDSAPFYFANRIASKLSEISKAKIIFGSATPPVSEYFVAEQKNIPISTINTSALTNKPPEIEKKIIDLSDSTEHTSYPLISSTLIEEMRIALENNEQVMVFINKRGSYRSVLCKNCGWQASCTNCDLPLVYHQDRHLAICHTCGHKEKLASNCPVCASPDIFFKSPGTKAVVESLAKIFPEATIARYDKDNKKHERLEANYEDVSLGKIDIIVGTQLIVKGFDLPKLSTVVMLITENSLIFPDYSSQERTFQLIKQLAGRVNRGHRKGQIILQTFKTDSELLNYPEMEWKDFYKTEITNRKTHMFPPFYYALKLQLSLKNRVTLESNLRKLADSLNTNKNLKILGPSPCFIEKKQDRFHWQLIIMSKNRKELTELMKSLPTKYRKDIDPISFL